MNKTPRKLYVTLEEHVALDRIAAEYSKAKLCLTVGAEDEYVDELATMLKADRAILLEHIWEVVVVETVVTRFGFDWTDRRSRREHNIATGRRRGSCRGR